MLLAKSTCSYLRARAPRTVLLAKSTVLLAAKAWPCSWVPKSTILGVLLVHTLARLELQPTSPKCLSHL